MEATVVMTMQHVATLTEVIAVHVNRHLLGMVEIAQVSKDCTTTLDVISSKHFMIDVVQALK